MSELRLTEEERSTVIAKTDIPDEVYHEIAIGIESAVLRKVADFMFKKREVPGETIDTGIIWRNCVTEGWAVRIRAAAEGEK